MNIAVYAVEYIFEYLAIDRMKDVLLDDQIPNVLGMIFPVGSSNISAKGLSFGGNKPRK